MKKFILYSAILAILSPGLTGCSKCGHCEKNGTTVISEVCNKNKTQYDGAVMSCESMSGTWETN